MRASSLTRLVIDDLDRDIITSGGATTPVLAPFTEGVLHELPTSSAADVLDAAARARLAQLAWARVGWAHRRAILLRAHDLLLSGKELLLDAVQTETGKTRGQAFEELFSGMSVTRYFALSARATLRTTRHRSGIPGVIRTRVGYSPKGVVGVITPWNYPLALSLMDVVPALAAGNAVVQKADNQCALTILAARRAFIEAGVPEDLWSVVTGDGAEIGNAVVDVADYVCFTGSTATGRTVAARSANLLTGASLELGGKNAMIVLDDVDPAVAARSAVYACFSSMGQLCVSIERIYVMRDVADAFTAEFALQTAALIQGSALDWSTDVGSLTNRAQFQRMQAHVDDAIKRGAGVLAGGNARPDLGPLFFAPTVLAGVTEEMSCAREETFGPLVAIAVVDSVAEAIVAANSGDYGLNASVFSGSISRARRVADALDVGSVNINEGYRATFGSVDAPMGGTKQSGLGRRNGREGLLRFVEPRTVAEATGLVTLPGTGREFARLGGAMIAVLVALKTIRRR